MALNISKYLINPVTKGINDNDRNVILSTFSSLNSPEIHDHILSLIPYINSRPAKYYQHEIYEEILKAFKEYSKDGVNLKEVLEDANAEISRALLFLNEANNEDLHEEDTKDDMDQLRFIDQAIHPSYLRLTEGVLCPLLKPMAILSRMRRGKGIEGLDTHNVIDEISRTSLSKISYSYRSIVRNGIAHGGIFYLDGEIKYQDKKGNEEKHSISEVIQIYDDLIDLCNGLACAYRVFYLSHQTQKWLIPHQISIDELYQETNCAWWSVEACIPSERAGLNQLAIYAKAHTYDYSKVFISAIQTGILAEYFIPGYDRYFISIKANMAYHGWAGFDGKKLRELRERETPSIDDYTGTLENNLVYYIPRPKLPKRLSKINSWFHAYRANKTLAFTKFRKHFDILTIQVRDAKIHRNLWGVVLEAQVYIKNDSGDLSPDIIRKNLKRILRRSLKVARSKLFIINLVRYLPIGHSRVSVFQKDYRIRRLRGFGLGEDLIGVIQTNYISRIKTININGGIVDSTNRRRLVWNQAWYKNHRT